MFPQNVGDGGGIDFPPTSHDPSQTVQTYSMNIKSGDMVHSSAVADVHILLLLQIRLQQLLLLTLLALLLLPLLQAFIGSSCTTGSGSVGCYTVNRWHNDIRDGLSR